MSDENSQSFSPLFLAVPARVHPDRVACCDRDHCDSRRHAPSGGGQSNRARQSLACISNLKQLELAWGMYADEHNDTLPPNKWRVVNWQDDCPEGGQAAADSWVLGDATRDKDSWNIQNGELFSVCESRRGLPLSNGSLHGRVIPQDSAKT